jgi:hypothetical protein
MASSFAKANQLPLFKEKNNFLNKLVGRAVEHYHGEIAKARNEVVLNQKRILHLFNNLNGEMLRSHPAMVCAYCLAAFSLKEAN